MRNILNGLFLCCLLFLTGTQARAFALLGPFPWWMQTTNHYNFQMPDDIGGPVDINSGYRWNVPVVTYGFDKSFLDFFGTNGVAAVVSAIQTLNNLPPASTLVLTNYPFQTLQLNYTAGSNFLFDLKSKTLSLLLQELGLAQPDRYVYVLKQWTPLCVTNVFQWLAGQPYDPYATDQFLGIYSIEDWAIPDYLGQFNFDPVTLQPSVNINGLAYSGVIANWDSQSPQLWTYLTDPEAFPDFPLVGYDEYLIFPYLAYNDGAYAARYSGFFFTGLTYDDVGGLGYLFSTNNINFETLLPSIAGTGTNASDYVNGAWRPGVDKITFVPQPVDSASGAFKPITNYFTDSYFTNGALQHQQLVRIISQPDFLFTAGSDWSRTGTTNWINNASLNGNTNETGPGIIRPQVVICCPKMGRSFFSTSPTLSPTEEAVQEFSVSLATFNSSTNISFVYPATQTGNVSMTVQVKLWPDGSSMRPFKTIEWPATSPAGTVFAMQTSTNLTAWHTLFVVTNNGSVCSYINTCPNSSSRFYRLIPQ